MMKQGRMSDAFQQPTISSMFGTTPSTNASKRKHSTDTDSASKLIKSDLVNKIESMPAGLTKETLLPSPKKQDLSLNTVVSPTCKKTFFCDSDSPIKVDNVNEEAPSSPSGAKSIIEKEIPDQMAVETPNLSKYVGLSIRKHFDGHGWYSGEIESCSVVKVQNISQCLWTVSYPDGDSEELDEDAILKGITEFENSTEPTMDIDNEEEGGDTETPSTSIALDQAVASTPSPKQSIKKNATTKKNKGSSQEETWDLPQGWKLEDRTNPCDAKVKPGETYKVWVAPDGRLYKSLQGAKKRHATSVEKPEPPVKEDKKSESPTKPLAKFFGSAAPKKLKDGTSPTKQDQHGKVEESIKEAVFKRKAESKEEWVQCETCAKWRKLPTGMNAESLSEKWICSLNDWDPTRNHCEAEQEVSNDDIDGVNQTNKKHQVSKKLNTKKIKKPLKPEAAEKVAKYQNELNNISVGHEKSLQLDTQFRAQQLKLFDHSNPEQEETNAVVSVDVEVMKNSMTWALEAMLVKEPEAKSDSNVDKMEIEQKSMSSSESSETVPSSPEAEIVSPTLETIPQVTSISNPLDKLIACFVQGSPVHLSLLVQQMKEFFESQANADEKEATLIDASIKKLDDESEEAIVEENKMNPDVKDNSTISSSSQLMDRAKLLRNVTKEELSDKIPLLAERKCYGVSLKGQTLLMLNEDVSSLTHSRWEVINLDLVNSSSRARKIIETARKDRRKVGSFIKIWSRLVDMIERHQDDSKVEAEEAKLNKLELEEKARLIKLAQAEAKELENKRALERNKAGKERKKLEALEKKEKDKAVQDAKNKEKAAEAALKAKIEKEAEEKKKKQSMKFVGFFKAAAATTTTTNSVSSSTAGSSSATPSTTSSSSPSSEVKMFAPSSNLSSSYYSPLSSKSTVVDLTNSKKKETLPPVTNSLLSFGVSTCPVSSSSASGGSVTSTVPASRCSIGATTVAMQSTVFYKRMRKRVDEFDQEAHDEDMKLKPTLDELSKLLASKKLSSSSYSSSSTSSSSKKKKSPWTTANVSMVTEINNENEAWGQTSSFVERKDRQFKNKMVLLQFQEDERPAWWGTWSKLSTVINGRRPLVKDQNKLRHYGDVNVKDGYQVNYEVDSEAEWEEEEPGEDLDNADEENEEEGAEEFDYADGWLRHDDDLGSDVEEEACSRYGATSDESPNPPSVEGPFLFVGGHESEEFPAHLKKYSAIPMPWIAQTTNVSQKEEEGITPLLKLSSFPLRVVDSLHDSLALYDVVQQKQQPSAKTASTSTNSSSSSSSPSIASTTATVDPAPTPETTAAALAAAASVVASLAQETNRNTETSNTPPAPKRVKTELKMVTAVDQLAFLAGLIHESNGWNCDKIISTFLSKYSEHSKSATKRTVDSIAEKKQRNWCLKPESLVKFGLKTQEEVDAMAVAAEVAAASSLKSVSPTQSHPSQSGTLTKPSEQIPLPSPSPSTTLPTKEVIIVSETKPLDNSEETKKRPVVSGYTIMDAFSKKKSPTKKLKITLDTVCENMGMMIEHQSNSELSSTPKIDGDMESDMAVRDQVEEFCSPENVIGEQRI